MSVYLSGNVLHYDGKDCDVSNIPSNIIEYFITHYNKYIENRLKLKGKVVGIKCQTIVTDFGWYKLAHADPVNTIPKGVWTRYGNTYYNSFLLIQGHREPRAKCLKCGKLVKGSFKDLNKHAKVCINKDLQDRVDHTWRIYGNLKYYDVGVLESSKEKVK